MSIILHCHGSRPSWTYNYNYGKWTDIQKDNGKLGEEEEIAPVDNLRDANIGKNSSAEKEELFDLISAYIDIFAVNPKVMGACEGLPIILELKDQKRPHAAILQSSGKLSRKRCPVYLRQGRFGRPTVLMPQPATPYEKRTARFVWCKISEGSI